MARDYALDRLKSEEQSLFQAKQTAWQRWMDAKDRADEAYEASQRAWEERCSANETMNREFEAMKSSSELIRRFGVNTVAFAIIIMLRLNP